MLRQAADVLPQISATRNSRNEFKKYFAKAAAAAPAAASILLNICKAKQRFDNIKFFKIVFVFETSGNKCVPCKTPQSGIWHIKEKPNKFCLEIKFYSVCFLFISAKYFIIAARAWRRKYGLWAMSSEKYFAANFCKPKLPQRIQKIFCRRKPPLHNSFPMLPIGGETVCIEKLLLAGK